MANVGRGGRGKQRSGGSTDGWGRLRNAVERNHVGVHVEAADLWRDLGDEGVWRCVVGQVAVIGRSDPWDKIKARWDRSGLDYNTLLLVLADGGTEAVATVVQRQFVKAGVRYAGTGTDPSQKALACGRNLLRLRALGGPLRFAEIVASIGDDHERIGLTRSLLAQVAEKGARDLLTGLGLLRQSIALDARVMSVLRAAGLTALEKAPSDRKAYAALEQKLIEEVAVPLGLEPAHLDRTLYQRTQLVIDAL